MCMNGDSASVWDTRFPGNGITAVGSWKKKWWYWDVLDASIWFCVSSAVCTPSVRWFEEGDYENELGPLGSDTWELVAYYIPSSSWIDRISKVVWVLLSPLELDTLSARMWLLVSKNMLGFVVWSSVHNCPGIRLFRDFQATSYPCRPSWWPKEESSRVLTAPTPLVFSYYSDLSLCHQLEQGFVWSIAVI